MSVPESIFRVKLGADPFQVYNDEEKSSSSRNNDFTELSGYNESMKVYLEQAVFAQREKFYAELDSAANGFEDFVKLNVKLPATKAKKWSVSISASTSGLTTETTPTTVEYGLYGMAKQHKVWLRHTHKVSCIATSSHPISCWRTALNVS